MHTQITLPVSALILLILASTASAKGLDALIEVGKGQAKIQKSYQEETKTYKAVKSAVADDKIKKGDPKDIISSRYGDPVVRYEDFTTGREKWVYRPASSDAFKGERVNIYFDAEGFVDEVQEETK